MDMDPTLDAPLSPRITAHFRPQEWVGDYAIDIDGAYDFDATDLILSWPLKKILAIVDHDYEADEVWRSHPVSAERPHDGPFEVEVVDSLRAYLAEYVDAGQRGELAASRKATPEEGASYHRTTGVVDIYSGTQPSGIADAQDLTKWLQGPCTSRLVSISSAEVSGEMMAKALYNPRFPDELSGAWGLDENGNPVYEED